MNLRALHSFVAALALVGCASNEISQEEADWKEAKRTNTAAGYQAFLDTHSDSEHGEVARLAVKVIQQQELKAERIRAAWPKLAAGMTLDEVNGLVGPIDEVSLQSFAEGIELGREYGMTDGTNTLVNQSPAGVYRLVFDSNGKLVKWNWE